MKDKIKHNLKSLKVSTRIKKSLIVCCTCCCLFLSFFSFGCNNVYADLGFTTGFTTSGIEYILRDNIYYFQPQWAKRGILHDTWFALASGGVMTAAEVGSLIGALGDSGISWDDVIDSSINDIKQGWNSVLNRVKEGTAEPKTASLVKKLLGAGTYVNDVVNTMNEGVNTLVKDIDKSIPLSNARSYYNDYVYSNDTYKYYEGDTTYTNIYNDYSKTFYNVFNTNNYNIDNYNYDFSRNEFNYYVDDTTSFNVKNYDNYVNVLSNLNGVTTEMELYYKLPSGANSYNLTANDIYGIKTDFNIENYASTFDYANLKYLSHLNANKDNIAYGNYDMVVLPQSIQYTNTNSLFDGALYINNEITRITIKHDVNNNIDLKNKTITFRLLPSYNTRFNLNINDNVNELVFDKITNSEITYEEKKVTQTTSTIIPTNYVYTTLPSKNANCGTSGLYVASGGNDSSGTGYTICRYHGTSSNTSSATTNYNQYFANTNEHTVETGLSSFLNYDSWNFVQLNLFEDGEIELAINGNQIDVSDTLFSNLDNYGAIHLDIEQNGYYLLDELYISDLINSFAVPLAPYDTNKVYILPNDLDVNNKIIIKSDIGVNNWQIGGVRESNANEGDVYISVDELGYLTKAQQYINGNWVNVDGAIYNKTLNQWVSISGYSIVLGDNSFTDLSTDDIDDTKTLTKWLDTAFNNLADKIVSSIDNAFEGLKDLLGIDVDNALTIDSDYDVDVENDLSGYLEDIQTIDNDISVDLDTDLGNSKADVIALASHTSGIFDAIEDNGLSIIWVAPLIIAIVRLVI